MEQNALGPAEKILQTVLSYSDHAVHNRPGVVFQDDTTVTGTRWIPVTHAEEGGDKVVYELRKVCTKSTKVKLGKMTTGDLPARMSSVLPGEAIVKDGNRVVGRYQSAGLYPEVVIWMYKQVAEVWKLDNEFAAKWASYAFKQEHRDLKTILAAFMLVQCRKGDPVVENDEVVFFDDDFRDVGEAMLLITDRSKKTKTLDAKLLLRIHEILTLPQVAEINRELGFGKSARHAFLGRWPGAVKRWLRYREENPRMLAGLVDAGFRKTVMKLASLSRYKPLTPRFYEVLRWKQLQSKTGHRSIAIGQDVAAAESWKGLSEEEICQTIVTTRPGYKRIVGLLPKEVGLTRAIMAAAVEAGSLSDKDLLIASATLEELGLLEVQDIRERWEAATKKADDMRAANIATRMKSQAAKDKLNEAADTALQKAVEEVVKGMRIYFMVDISSSMTDAITKAKDYIGKFLQGFPKDSIHIATFNTAGRVVTLRHDSAAGVAQAFRGIQAGGGTNYGAGVYALSQFKPKEDEDALFIFVGDEQAADFDDYVRRSGLNPVAFGFLYVPGNMGHRYNAVTSTATKLGIPCFNIDERIFDDPYAIPRTIHNLIASTPVGKTTAVRATPRVSLVDTILKTDLLQKPAWVELDKVAAQA
jgi:hypothetical protein